MEQISIDTFWKLLHDPSNRGFDIKYRKASDGTFGMKRNLGKSGKRFEGKGTKGKLRYDVIEKGVVLLEDIDGLGRPFALRNRLLMAVRLPRTETWYKIVHKNY
ncbi:hypothetical protein [Dyadobacter sp. CY323]|uniref:hypothetical protein n=1 Tax=Dyadobacter sp. CY323 TaxID=2907302 RepID=UPI001F19E5F2|nr:hypothetical protein [Dyadobacter sp. CY323]MCE6987476.1 hypothetical protein [Dyadobacter sp. CY323]